MMLLFSVSYDCAFVRMFVRMYYMCMCKYVRVVCLHGLHLHTHLLQFVFV